MAELEHCSTHSIMVFNAQCDSAVIIKMFVVEIFSLYLQVLWKYSLLNAQQMILCVTSSQFVEMIYQSPRDHSLQQSETGCYGSQQVHTRGGSHTIEEKWYSYVPVLWCKGGHVFCCLTATCGSVLTWHCHPTFHWSIYSITMKRSQAHFVRVGRFCQKYWNALRKNTSTQITHLYIRTNGSSRNSLPAKILTFTVVYYLAMIKCTYYKYLCVKSKKWWEGHYALWKEARENTNGVEGNT